MRNAARRGALFLATALAATGVGFTSSPSVAAAPCPGGLPSCVVVSVVSTQNFERVTKESFVVSPEDLDAWSSADPNITDEPFYVRDKVGNKEKRVDIKRPLSLQELLAKQRDAGAPPVTFSEVTGDDGIPRVLDKPALGNPTDDDYPFDDRLPPVVYRLSGDRIGYFRPLTGKDDANRSDWIVRKGRLNLTIHTTGKLLEPTVSVSNSAPTTKDKTTFSVSLSEKPGTRLLKYRWEFGDDRGPDRDAETPVHRYTKRGTYGAVVSVRGGNGSYGRSDVLTVKVDKPPKPPKPPKAATSDTGGNGLGGTGGGGYVPPYVAPVPGLPDAVDDFGQDDPLEDEPVEEIPVDDGLVDVEGYVLAGAEIVPGGTPEAIPGTEASQAAPVSQTSVRSRIATWTVAALAIALLVGAGAASETRWLRNRLRPLRRRA